MSARRSSMIAIALALGALAMCGTDPDPAPVIVTGPGGAGGGGSGGQGVGGLAAGGAGGSVASTTTGAGGSGGTLPDPACDPPSQLASKGLCVPFSGTGGGGGAAAGFAYPINCNPVTGVSCGADEVCAPLYGDDWGAILGFRCVAIVADAGVCELCDSSNGPWCGNTLTCYDSACRRFCCETADCGPYPAVECRKVRNAQGAPIFEQLPNLGVCLPPAP